MRSLYSVIFIMLIALATATPVFFMVRAIVFTYGWWLTGVLFIVAPAIQLALIFLWQSWRKQ